MQVRIENLVDRVASKGEPAGPEMAVGHGQRVLVGLLAHPAVEHFGRDVVRRHIPRMVAGASLEDLGHAEVRQPGRSADEKDVVRLDVAMLHTDLATVARLVPRLVEVVDRTRHLVHITDELVIRQAGQTLVSALAQTIPEALLTERHGDH